MVVVCVWTPCAHDLATCGDGFRLHMGLWNLVSLLSLVKDGCKHRGRGEESWGGVVLWHWHQGGVSDNKSISRKDTLTGWDMSLKGNPNMMGEPDGETDQAERVTWEVKVWGQSSPGREAGSQTGSYKGRAGRTKERGRHFRLEDLALINKELDLGDVVGSLEGSGSPPAQQNLQGLYRSLPGFSHMHHPEVLSPASLLSRLCPWRASGQEVWVGGTVQGWVEGKGPQITQVQWRLHGDHVFLTILFSKGTGKTYRRKTRNLSQEGRQPASSMVGKQKARELGFHGRESTGLLSPGLT